MATRDFAQIIREKLANDPELAESVEEEAVYANIAQEIYDARKQAGLTQSQLAERVGTHQSVIARLEDADYEKHSVAMLRKIAAALDMRLRVTFQPKFRLSASSVSSIVPQWDNDHRSWKPTFNTRTTVPAA